MITAFDELSSHLHTTFSALSTALARNQTRGSTDTVYLALVLGPTIGAPKARVILALEGLEVKVWGTREEVEEARLSSDAPREDDDADDCSSNDGSEASGDSHEEAEEDTSSDVTDTEESPPPSEPPSSRSPSPLSEEPSLPSSPAPAISSGASRRPLRPSLSPKSSPSSSASQPYLAPKPTQTHAEEQQTLRAAERLLARTLVNAYAESVGIMAAELGARSLFFTRYVVRVGKKKTDTARSSDANTCPAPRPSAFLAPGVAPAAKRERFAGPCVAGFPRRFRPRGRGETNGRKRQTAAAWRCRHQDGGRPRQLPN